MNQLDQAVQELGALFTIPKLKPSELETDMPKCLNFPRFAVEEWTLPVKPEKWAWISVQEPDCKGQKYAHTKNEILDKLNNLKIKFWDLTKPCEGSQGDEETIYPPTESDAASVVDFIKLNEGKSFIINCAAGVRRSGAICQFLEHCLNYKWPECNKMFAMPNKHLFSLMVAYYTGETYEHIKAEYAKLFPPEDPYKIGLDGDYICASCGLKSKSERCEDAGCFGICIKKS